MCILIPFDYHCLIFGPITFLKGFLCLLELEMLMPAVTQYLERGAKSPEFGSFQICTLR